MSTRMFRLREKSERINLIENLLIGRTWPLKKGAEGEGILSTLSAVIVVLDLWLVIDGVLSIVKYPKQSFPEHLIRVIRATIGAVIIIIVIVQK